MAQAKQRDPFKPLPPAELRKARAKAKREVGDVIARARAARQVVEEATRHTRRSLDGRMRY